MTRTKSIYSIHPSLQMIQKWVAELKEKTGRSVDEWAAFLRKSGPKGDAARRDWLKKEHGLGTNAAWWLTDRAAGRGEEDSDPQKYLEAAERYVKQMFAGKKAALRPIYDRLLQIGLSIGKGAKACPCKTIVPLYRKNVFAQIKPATNSRIDLGFYLKGAKVTGKRLIDTGGLAKGDRITHRIPIESIDQIDDEVRRWMKAAYDLSA
jgi:hypothetical protein